MTVNGNYALFSDKGSSDLSDEQPKKTIHDLPKDIIRNIFNNLSVADLKHCSQVCKHLSYIAGAALEEVYRKEASTDEAMNYEGKPLDYLSLVIDDKKSYKLKLTSKTCGYYFFRIIDAEEIDWEPFVDPMCLPNEFSWGSEDCPTELVSPQGPPINFKIVNEKTKDTVFDYGHDIHIGRCGCCTFMGWNRQNINKTVYYVGKAPASVGSNPESLRFHYYKRIQDKKGTLFPIELEVILKTT